MPELKRGDNPEGVGNIVPPTKGVQDIIDRQTGDILSQTKAEKGVVEEAQRIAWDVDLAKQKQAVDHRAALGRDQNIARGACVQVIPAYQYVQPYIDDKEDMGYVEPTETGAIVLPILLPGIKFDITSVMIQLLTLKGMFVGLPIDDANLHLTNFLVICNSYTDLGQEALRLRCFPFYLTREAFLWLGELPRGFITAWNELRRQFFNRWQVSELKGKGTKETNLKKIKANISRLTQKVESYATAIKKLEHYFRKISVTLNQRQLGTLPSNTVQNLKYNDHILAISMRSGITTMDPPMPTIEVVDDDMSVSECGKVAQSATAQPGIKSTRISPPHTHPPDDNDEKEIESQLTPQTDEESQDSSEKVEQEQSSILPQSKKGVLCTLQSHCSPSHKDVEHKVEKVEMARWIAIYISPLGDEAPWIMGQAMIKKGLLTLEAKFWWLLIRYCLFPTASDNTLTWEGATLVAYLMACSTLILLPFSGVPKLSGIDERVTATVTVQMRTTKGLVHPTTSRRSREQAVAPLAQTEGPTVSAVLDEEHIDDAGIGIDIKIKEKRDALDLSTQGEGTQDTSFSALASTSELVGTSIKTAHPYTIALTSGMITVSSEFLQSLVDSQRAIAARMKVVETEMTTLFE
ncbi:hypothetical protein FXO37_07403 [Capsicum annuum]|nr:hypothetical protein FXO37_07403 [Capsicum annuum]